MSIFLVFMILAGVCYGESYEVINALKKNPPFKISSVNPRKLFKHALIVTNKGKMKIKFYSHKAPLTVANFQFLVVRGYYDGVKFHKKIRDTALLSGDRKGDGTGSVGWSIEPEIWDKVHEKGTFGMSRVSDRENMLRRSSGSHFYIATGQAKHLDSAYTVFAQIIDGFSTFDKLKVGDRIEKIYLYN